MTPFAAPFIWGLMIVIVFGSIGAILFRGWKTRNAKILFPLGFLIAFLLATQFVDFTEPWISVNYKQNLQDREEVISRIEIGELVPNVPHNPSLISLPVDLAKTSMGGGEVIVQHDEAELKVFFFIFRGVLDSFAGFVYSSDDSTPVNGDFAGNFLIIRKMEDQWFYVSAK